MIRIRYELTPLARVSAGRTGEVSASKQVHTVLPGSVIRGALGAVWWTSPTERFRPAAAVSAQDVFDDFFGSALIVGQALPMVAEASALPVHGLSEYHCKYPVPGCLSGYRDAATRYLDGSDPLDGTCPVCRQPWEHRKSAFDGQELDALQTTATRTALEGGVPKTGQLFQRRSVRREVRYVGELHIDEGANAEAIAWLRSITRISVGGQKSTLGRCAWTVTGARAAAAAPSGACVVRLQSPTLLVDDCGSPTVDLKAELCRHTASGKVVTDRHWQRPEQLSGWHGVAGLPKPVEWAVAAGSTAVLLDWTPSELAALTEGIGLRRLEGFGQIELLTVESLTTASMTVEGVEAAQGEVIHEEPAAEAVVQAAPTRHPAEEFLDDAPSDLRAATGRGLLSAARMVKRKLENGFPPSLLSGDIARITEYPWARDLPGAMRDRLAGLLLVGDLTETITVLEARVGGTK